MTYWSTIFISLVTAIALRKGNARSVDWVKFMLIFFGGFTVSTLFVQYCMTDQNPILNVIVETLILFIANILFVNLQVKFESKTDDGKANKKLNKYVAFNEGVGGSQTSVTSNLADYDYDESRFSASEISGVRTMQATLTKSDTLTLNIRSTVESGNMGIFIIVDGAIYCEVKINSEETIPLENISGKTVIVRFGAESAKATISVARY